MRVTARCVTCESADAGDLGGGSATKPQGRRMMTAKALDAMFALRRCNFARRQILSENDEGNEMERMKKKKRRLTRAAAAVLVILLAACIGLLVYSRNKNVQGETQKKIGAVYMTMNNPYFNVVNEKIKSVVRSRGDVMVTRDSALDSEMQNRQIEAFVQDGVDAILVNAVDWIKVEPALADARAAGIPVIAVDALVRDSSLVDGSIISDNYQAGRSLCKRPDAAQRQRPDPVSDSGDQPLGSGPDTGI